MTKYARRREYGAERKAVPFVAPPGMKERVEQTLRDFAAAVRADKARPLTDEEWQAQENMRRFG